MEDYPKNMTEFIKRFDSEEACRKYLFELRWPDGFECPKCKGGEFWPMKSRSGLLLCGQCRRQVSVTAGTIFQDSRLPLKKWFHAMWYLTSQKNGTSALGLQRVLGFGSYQTAWAWLHKIRRAMVRPVRDRLSGVVEVDETYVGSAHPGKQGHGAVGKYLVLIAAKQDGRGTGRIRLAHIGDASGQSLGDAIKESVEQGSTILTDGWSGYSRLSSLGYKHQIVRREGCVGESLLPRCSSVAISLNSWLLGTRQGSFGGNHLRYYLDEFTFRFNRRASHSHGKLFYHLVQQAVQIEPVPYKLLVSLPPVGGG